MQRFLTVLTVAIASSLAAAPATEIAPGVHLIRGEFVRGRQPDGNTVIFSTAKGSVVVDTGRHPSHTRSILEFAQTRKKPIRAVINTHWHLDHVGGNVLLRGELRDVPFYATNAIDDAMRSFLASYAKQLEQVIATSEGEEERRYQAELGLIQAGDKLKPDVVIQTSGMRDIAGRTLHIEREPHATTAADLWIFDNTTGVLVAGDLVTLPYPFLDTACVAGWKEALGKVTAADFRLVVPGHGAPMNREEVSRYQRAFENFLACGTDASRSRETCASGWINDIGDLVPSSDHDHIREALAYYVDHVLRVPGVVQICDRG